ncbi:hypothetical protein [Myxococcus xanthus]|uniref:hypothetical protein n=1 Tax=Myxococcus xanthus TaxID=34 RepID=UPI0013755DBE|nr:hypothetical protein [Myxococcus xanthus]
MNGLKISAGQSAIVLELPSDVDGHILSARLRNYGVDASLIEMFVRPECPTRSGAVVLGLKGPCEIAARAYAAASGRKLVILDNSTQAMDIWLEGEDFPPSLLFFIPENEFDLRLCHEFIQWAGEHGVASGIMPVPEDPTQAMLKACRLIALEIRATPYPHGVLTFNDFPSSSHGTGSYFGSARADDFIHAISEGANALVLSAHGNGADFKVGKRVLCVQADGLAPEPGQPGETFLPCQTGGACLREPTHARAEFVGPGALRVAAVVMLSCSGIVPKGGVFDARFSFSEALFRGEHVRGVVAAYRYIVLTPDACLEAARLLRAGASLGELTLSLNKHFHAECKAYVCLGDPDFRPFAPNQAHSASLVESRSEALPRSSPGRLEVTSPKVIPALTSYLSIADFFLAIDVGPEPSEKHRVLMDELRGTIATALRNLGLPSSRQRLALDARIAQTLAGTLPVYDTHLAQPLFSHYKLLQQRPGPNCSVCGGRTIIGEYAALLHWGYSRRLMTCTNHGVLADHPIGTGGEDVGASLTVEAHHLRVMLSPPTEHRVQGIAVSYRCGDEAVKASESDTKVSRTGEVTFTVERKGTNRDSREVVYVAYSHQGHAGYLCLPVMSRGDA